MRVTAVTTGEYASVLRVAGDVFDLASPADYSDSTVNYQAGGNETRFGWMLTVPDSTPLYCWITDGPPQFPPVDPKRSFID